MKKILGIFFAVMLLSCLLTVSANAAVVASAAPATDTIPVADGIKDEVYEQSTPITIGAEGDALWGKAYFAYDKEYLYVFCEVHDETLPASASFGSITQASLTDSAYITFDLLNKDVMTAVWGASAVTEENYWGGTYGAMRLVKNNTNVYEGAHTMLNQGGKRVGVAVDENNYVTEFKIPWGVDFSKTKYDVDAIINSGISVVFSIIDAPAGSTIEEKPEVAIYTSNGMSTFRGANFKTYAADTEGTMDRLEFIAGEFKTDRVEATTTVVTTAPPPVVSNPPVVTTTQPSTPPVATPPVAPVTTVAPATTPEAITPEATTPEATTPEATTPEVTTPEVTTPEETTPEATTTPDVTTDVAEESGAPVALIAIIALAVVAVVVVAVVVLKKKK